MSVGLPLLINFGPTGSGGSDPLAADLSVSDKMDGTGAVGTVSGGEPGATNEVYRAVLPAAGGEFNWILTGTIAGAGSLDLPAGAGNWFWQVRSTLGGLTTVGDTVYRPTTDRVPEGLDYQIVNNSDGTGLTVWIGFGGPADVHNIEVRQTDKADSDFVVAGTRTGRGFVTVPVEPQDSSIRGVSLVRPHFVRIASSPSGGGPVGYSQRQVWIPTAGLESSRQAALLAITQELLALSLPRIDGRVYFAIDPDGAISQVTTYPAIFVYREAAETRGNQDNKTTSWLVPWTVRIADRVDPDYIYPIEWYEFARETIIDHFDRRQKATGRKWMVTPGLPYARDEAKYEYLYSLLTVTVDLERRIGG